MTEYVPGVCNIGGAERGRRMRLGILAAAFFVVGLVLLLALGWPAWLRLGLALPAAGAAANVLQVRRRFCAGFAWAGVANLKSS